MKLVYRELYDLISGGAKEFKDKKVQDFNQIIRNWKQFGIRTSKFPQIPLNHRRFFEIDQFKLFEDHKFLSKSNYNLGAMMHSDLKSVECPSSCDCKNPQISIRDFCQPDYERQDKVVWKSKCPNKRENIECD